MIGVPLPRKGSMVRSQGRDLLQKGRQREFATATDEESPTPPGLKERPCRKRIHAAIRSDGARQTGRRGFGS